MTQKICKERETFLWALDSIVGRALHLLCRTVASSLRASGSLQVALPFGEEGSQDRCWMLCDTAKV
jgi:hypothetical protein